MAESRKALRKVEGQMEGMVERREWRTMAEMATYVLFTVHADTDDDDDDNTDTF